MGVLLGVEESRSGGSSSCFLKNYFPYPMELFVRVQWESCPWISPSP
jgi:hypothetical protein